jgi:hypothetical protein
MPTIIDNLDAPLDDSEEWIWGIEAIAAAANLYHQNKAGETVPHIRKAAHLLYTGALAGRCVKGRDQKTGKEHSRGQWVSSRRLIDSSLLPETR